MNRIFVIFNPSARGEKSRRMRRLIEDHAAARDHIEFVPTQGPGDATRLAREAVSNGYHVVVAAGGDGTVNEVTNGIGLSDTRLGVLPLGTVNVFARELGIPLRLAAAWSAIEAGVSRRIDLGCANAGGRQRYFVQLGGVGFDAWAVQHANWELKKKIGPLSYVWAGLKALNKPCGRVVVSANNGHEATEGAVVLVGNGRYYGGPFPVFPSARMDDGKLDICVFMRGGYWDVMRYLQGVPRGAHIRLKDVRYFQADQFECRPHTTNVPFELDGELAGEAPVLLHVLPRALNVIVPA
jgi:YegS/Rv2252/BmrU family lipid kinase